MSDALGLDHDRLRTLWSLLSYHATGPERIAMAFEGRETSYGMLRDSALSLAARLSAKGFGVASRIGYLGKNSDHYFVLLFAVARIGAVLVPLNWRLAQAELAFIVDDSTMSALFCDEEFFTQAQNLADPRAMPAVILSDEIASARHSNNVVGLGELADYDENADCIVFQVYTSGTTGRPKGAMLTNHNMLALRAPGYEAKLQWFPTRTSTVGVVLPVAHIAGTAYALFGFYAGARVAICREFDPHQVLCLIRDAQVDHLLLAPAAMQLVMEHPSAVKDELSSLKFITYGAAPIPEALLRDAIAMFGCGFVQMYGMSEAAGGVVALEPDDHMSQEPGRLRAAGRAMPGAEVSIVDNQWAHLPPNSIGEIVIRSPSNMVGYWNKPEANDEIFDAGGWMRTGDIGRMDADGYVYVLDRAKDMIISGGENIYPAEVESAIFGHPDVADVAVIGVPSVKWGEEVVAVIVPRPGKRPSVTELTSWLDGKLARFKMPKQVTFTESLPRNAGNKILRRALREPYWEGQSRRVN